MIGQHIGKYRITRLIGEGGMGAVYEAVHDEIHQRVAVKVLHPAYSVQPALIQRFFNEARAVNIISHPGLVKTFDFGRFPDGTAYMTMELLEGESLGDRLRGGGGRLPLPEALRVCRQVASALCAAHDKGIVHRDLKPDNLFLVPDPEAQGGERAKILDFGIAKVRAEALGRVGPGINTATGAVMGTPLYMAPEQCRGAGAVGERADVYSLGVILYQVLCGRPPFVAEGHGDLMVMHITQPPPALQELAPEVPAEVAALVHRMLAKPPQERPDMRQVAAELERLGAARAQQAPHPEERGHVALPLLQAPSTLGQATGAAQPRAAASRAGLLSAAALAMAVPGLWVVLRHKEPPPAPVMAQPPRPAPPAARYVACSLTSAPSGAQVLRVDDGSRVGITPLSTRLTPGDAGLALIVRQAGFADQTVTLDPRTGCQEEVALDVLPVKKEPVNEPQHFKHRPKSGPRSRPAITTKPPPTGEEDYRPPIMR